MYLKYSWNGREVWCIYYTRDTPLSLPFSLSLSLSFSLLLDTHLNHWEWLCSYIWVSARQVAALLCFHVKLFFSVIMMKYDLILVKFQEYDNDRGGGIIFLVYVNTAKVLNIHIIFLLNYYWEGIKTLLKIIMFKQAPCGL